MIIPFLGMGADQLANNCVGELPTEDRAKFCGDNETGEKKGTSIV